MRNAIPARCEEYRLTAFGRSANLAGMNDRHDQATRAMDIAIELGASYAARYHWISQGSIPEIWRLRISLHAQKRGETLAPEAMEQLPRHLSIYGSAEPRTVGRPRRAKAGQ